MQRITKKEEIKFLTTKMNKIDLKYFNWNNIDYITKQKKR